jgi:putative aldouronate transport system substrate-binding protein
MTRQRVARSRKAVALLAASLLVVSAGCSSDGDGNESGSTNQVDGDQSEVETSEAGEQPAAEGIALSVFAPAFPDQDLATNEFTKKVQDRLGITINWETTTLDGGPAKERRQLSLASGEYPDVFLLIPWVDQFSQVELLDLANQGIAVPLNDLIAEHAPNIQKSLDALPEYKKMSTAPDGNIYGLPQWIDCFHCSYQAKLWMNSQWLENLGLEAPTTTEELRTVLRAFKDNDPNGNGQADEVPLSGSVRDSILPFLMSPFVYTPQGTSGQVSTLVLDDGSVAMQATSEGWRQGLAYAKSLWDEGLIDPGAFSQNPDALSQLGNVAGDVVLGSATTLHPAIFVGLGSEDGRDAQYDAVAPLTGPDGTRFTAYNFPSTPGATFVITDRATPEERVAAIKLLDYLFTDEGQINALYGTEGVTWEVPGADDVALDADVKPLYKNTDPDLRGQHAWMSIAQYNNTAEFRAAEAVSSDIYDPAGFERRLFEATQQYAGLEDKDSVFPSWAVWLDAELSSEVATLQTNLDSYVQQSAAEFVTGVRDLDADWDAYLAELDSLGLARYLEIYQAAYDSQVGG